MTARVALTSGGSKTPAKKRVRASRAPESKGAGRGGPKRDYSWPPFEEGNTVALRHGAYATLALKPRAEEIAGRLREAMGDAFEDTHTAAVEAGALAGARVEAALGHLLDETNTEELKTLDANARSWLRLYLDTLERLGLTPQVGVSGPAGPTTFSVLSAFPGVTPHADVIELEAEELPALEEGDGS